MSYFSNTLQTILDRHAWRQKDAKKIFGISTSGMNLYIAGARKPASEQLDLLLRPLTEPEQSELLIAVMHDVVPTDDYRALVHISPAKTTAQKQRASESHKRLPLAKKTAEAIALLTEECATDPALQASLVAMADFVRITKKNRTPRK